MEQARIQQVHPFGEADCEAEIAILGEEYSHYYFSHTRFNDVALDKDVYLIVGRRGSGKTALAHYFTFQKRLRNAIAIDVDEPSEFQHVLNRIASTAAYSREVAIPRIAKIWELVIWAVIFRELQDQDLRIKAACIFGDQPGKVSHFVFHLFKSLLSRFLKTDESLADELESLVSDGRIVAGKEAVLELARTRALIVAFDTLENFTIDDDALMRATAGLIQCASDFNRKYATKNIHLKLFLMAEIFPYLKEGVILNTLKVVRNEIYLHWRPKGLMRLISWRLHRYLRYNRHSGLSDMRIDWNDQDDVRRKVWDIFFGRQIVNGRGIAEKTLPYILSNTQLRPRQLIVLCNRIAGFAQERGHFPYFHSEDIINGIRHAQRDLADEVCNSYSSVYPNVGQIIDALSGLPMQFPGKRLDKVAPRTAAAWSTGGYSPLNFRKLVVELGIVGRVRQVNDKAGFVEADFEYATEDRISITEEDQCVVHPMFYEKLHIAVDHTLRVYPFPDHEDFRDALL
jgi:hypothetical protein